MDEIKLSFVVGDFSEKIFDDELQKEEAEQRIIKSHGSKTCQGKPRAKPEQSQSRMLFTGRKFSGEPAPLKQLTEEQDQVIVYGEIFRFESRISKTGRKFYLGRLRIISDSIEF